MIIVCRPSPFLFHTLFVVTVFFDGIFLPRYWRHIHTLFSSLSLTSTLFHSLLFSSTLFFHSLLFSSTLFYPLPLSSLSSLLPHSLPLRSLLSHSLPLSSLPLSSLLFSALLCRYVHQMIDQTFQPRALAVTSSHNVTGTVSAQMSDDNTTLVLR
jgi:hypothetical protein